MAQFYTLNNIYYILKKNYPSVNWEYEIYDRKTGIWRTADIKDFHENQHNTITLCCTYKDDYYSLDVNVSDFNFIVYEDKPNIMDSGSTTQIKDNFTDEWIDYLLRKHKEEYAKKLLAYSEKCKQKINERANEEIAKIQEKAQRDSQPYNALSKKAKNILPAYDILTIESEV